EANVGNIRTTRDIIVSSGFYNFDIRTRPCRKRDSNVKINPLATCRTSVTCALALASTPGNAARQ
ncbi:MAG: hypothetical protein ABIM50_14280, partial [Novosphingobium sp.]